MYRNLFRTRSIRSIALAASLLPAFLSGTAQAVQFPEDKLIPFAEPIPYMPFFESGEFDEHDVLMSLDGYDGFGTSNTLESLEDESKKIDELIKEARDYVDKAKKSEDKAKQRAAEARLEALEKASVATRKSVERARHLAPLHKKVDVKFENATVAQAAEALSRASGVQIKVDSGISDTTRLTVEARKVRLSTVLESVARQAGLTIDPINLEKGDIGVELSVPPMLRVNDTVQRFPVSASPWSEKWGAPPTRRFIYTSRAPSVFNFTNSNGQPVARAYANGVSAEAMGNLAALGQQFSTTVTGRTVIQSEKGTTIEVSRPGTVTVTEAAKNDKNEDGYWKTVYTLKNGELIQQSRTWEKAKAKKAAIAIPDSGSLAIPDSGSLEFSWASVGKA